MFSESWCCKNCMVLLFSLTVFERATRVGEIFKTVWYNFHQSKAPLKMFQDWKRFFSCTVVWIQWWWGWWEMRHAEMRQWVMCSNGRCRRKARGRRAWVMEANLHHAHFCLWCSYLTRWQTGGWGSNIPSVTVWQLPSMNPSSVILDNVQESPWWMLLSKRRFHSRAERRTSVSDLHPSPSDISTVCRNPASAHHLPCFKNTAFSAKKWSLCFCVPRKLSTMTRNHFWRWRDFFFLRMTVLLDYLSMTSGYKQHR